MISSEQQIEKQIVPLIPFFLRGKIVFIFQWTTKLRGGGVEAFSKVSRPLKIPFFCFLKFLICRRGKMTWPRRKLICWRTTIRLFRTSGQQNIKMSGLRKLQSDVAISFSCRMHMYCEKIGRRCKISNCSPLCPFPPLLSSPLVDGWTDRRYSKKKKDGHTRTYADLISL